MKEVDVNTVNMHKNLLNTNPDELDDLVFNLSSFLDVLGIDYTPKNADPRIFMEANIAVKKFSKVCKDEEEFKKLILEELEYELMNFIYSKLSKYKDTHPKYPEAISTLLTTVIYITMCKFQESN